MTDREIIHNFLLGVQKEIHDNHVRAGQLATGKTMRSLEIETTDNGGQLTGASHINALETGTLPGIRPSIQSISEWMHAKKVKGDANLISEKIYKVGSNLFELGGRKDIITSAITPEKIGVIEKIFGDKYFNKFRREAIAAFK